MECNILLRHNLIHLSIKKCIRQKYGKKYTEDYELITLIECLSFWPRFHFTLLNHDIKLQVVLDKDNHRKADHFFQNVIKFLRIIRYFYV